MRHFEKKTLDFLAGARLGTGSFGDLAPAIDAVVAAGFGAEPFAGADTELQHAHESHRSVSGRGDRASMDILFARLSASFPQANILCEEDSEYPNALPKESPKGILSGTVFVVDPVDGTSLFGANLGGWCAALGMLQDGETVGSAVFAPTVHEGLLVVARKGEGLTVIERGRTLHVSKLKKRKLAEEVILVGVDTLQYPAITAFIPRLTAKVRAVYTSGSASLGLIWVALGRAGAIMQTPQRIWDIVPAYHALLETGRKILLYRIDPKTAKLVRVKSLDFNAYCYAQQHRVGIIAGEASTVDYLTELLWNAGPIMKADQTLND